MKYFKHTRKYSNPCHIDLISVDVLLFLLRIFFFFKEIKHDRASRSPMPCLVLSLPRALAPAGAQDKHTTFRAVKFKSVHFLHVPGQSFLFSWLPGT